jgi:predicted 3-demethylubiquinone-9 3-methyltransferase (glyoxalase superfamily)
VVPQQLIEPLTGPDPEKVRRVTAALMQMKKIDLQTLPQAAG